MEVEGSQPVSTAVAEPVLLRAANVSKVYGRARVLKSVTLEVASGEICGLVGQNGAGKSTLIKVLAGLVEPEDGADVTVGGQPLAFGDPRASYSMGLRFVHQRLGLVPQFTATENIGVGTGFVRRLGQISWSGQDKKVQGLIDRVGMPVDIHRPVGELKAVERTAVAIARALDETSGAVRLLILDEPTSALPGREVEHLFAVLRGLSASGIGIVYVSHRLGEITSLCGAVTVIRDGQVVANLSGSGIERSSLIEHMLGEDASIMRRETTEASDAATDVATDPPGVVARASSAITQPVLRVVGLHSGTLQGVDIDLYPGEIVGVAGLNGSGREDVLRAVGSVGGAGSKEMWVDGELVAKPNPSLLRALGVVLVLGNRDGRTGIGGFTAAENLFLEGRHRVGQSRVVHPRVERSAALGYMEEFDVRPRNPDLRFTEFSGGNQQKLMLAKWLSVASPKVAVVDEPTLGVDVGSREVIFRIVRRYAQQGLAVLVASSDLDDLIAMCSRTIVLGGGSIIGEVDRSEMNERVITAVMTKRELLDEAKTGGS